LDIINTPIELQPPEQLPMQKGPPVITAATYTIQYSEKSPIKAVPLKNGNLNIQVYYNGNPMGVTTVTTDDYQYFTFDQYKDKNEVVLEIVSIADQEKYNARCYGNPKTVAGHDLLITCVPDPRMS
jgi:hypothetical protein